MILPVLSLRQRAVFSAIVSEPGIHVSAAARRAGVRQDVADRAVIRLEKLGLVRSTTRPVPAGHHLPPCNRRLCYPAPEVTA